MQFTVTLSFEDYLAANRLVVRRHWSPGRTARIFAIASAIYFAIAVSVDRAMGELSGKVVVASLALALAASAAVLVVLIALSWLLLPYRARKMFKQLGTVDWPTEYRFDDDKMVSIADSGQANVPYGMITDYLVDDRQIVLRRTPLIIFAIPRDQIDPSQSIELLRLLDAHGVKRT